MCIGLRIIYKIRTHTIIYKNIVNSNLNLNVKRTKKNVAFLNLNTEKITETKILNKKQHKKNKMKIIIHIIKKKHKKCMYI